jgi:hypothetical protein
MVTRRRCLAGLSDPLAVRGLAAALRFCQEIRSGRPSWCRVKRRTAPVAEGARLSFETA